MSFAGRRGGADVGPQLLQLGPKPPELGEDDVVGVRSAAPRGGLDERVGDRRGRDREEADQNPVSRLGMLSGSVSRTSSPPMMVTTTVTAAMTRHAALNGFSATRSLHRSMRFCTLGPMC